MAGSTGRIEPQKSLIKGIVFFLECNDRFIFDQGRSVTAFTVNFGMFANEDETRFFVVKPCRVEMHGFKRTAEMFFMTIPAILIHDRGCGMKSKVGVDFLF